MIHTDIARCYGMREPLDDQPAAWIEPCLQCKRRADRETLREGEVRWYVTPPVTLYRGSWRCGSRLPAQEPMTDRGLE